MTPRELYDRLQPALTRQLAAHGIVATEEQVRAVAANVCYIADDVEEPATEKAKPAPER